jgi:molybdate transport system regulatory protein
MLKKKKSIESTRIIPRLRVMWGDEVAFGPGKAALLVAVAETGSIREAAARLGMSYMHAWKLIRTMNRCFAEPLVVSVRGGHTGGGATLTDVGKKTLALYLRMERDCLAAINQDWGSVKRGLRKAGGRQRNG